MHPLSIFHRSAASRLRDAASEPWLFVARVIALAAALSCGASMTSAQEVEWLHQFGTEGYDDGTGIAAHESGVYVIGRVQGALPGQTARGVTDSFVRKYDLSGVEIWTRQFSLNDNITSANAIDVDDTGVYVAGSSFCAVEGPQCGGFVRKYGQSGNLIWTHAFPVFPIGDLPTTMLDVFGIDVDATGIYVAGSGILNGSATALVSRLDPMGNEVWKKLVALPFPHPEFGFLQDAFASGIAVDATGVYVAGSLGTADVLRLDFNGTLVDEYGDGTLRAGDHAEILATDDSGVYVTATPCPPDCQSIAVRKFDRNGNELWTRKVPDTSIGGDLAIDEHGVYLTGALEPEFFMFSAFVVKYEKDGDLDWVHELDTNGFERGYGLAAHDGKLYVTGFTDDVFPGQTATPLQDVFVAALNQRSVPHVLSDILPTKINPRSNGVIPLVIFTTPDFDATRVDPLSVRFGPGAAVEAHGRGHLQDADGDGDTDLVLHFATRATAIACGDTEASFSGETFAGDPIEGSDTFATTGCR